MIAAADISHSIGDALSNIVRVVGEMSVLDWILIGVALYLLAWAWVRALAFVRLGTIQVDELQTDDQTLGALGIKAELQRQLGDRGWLPASGLPGGSPSVAGLANAISEAPIEQARWLGALLRLVPTPPTSTSFRLGGTLRTRATVQGQKEFGITYQLVRLTPRQKVRLSEQWAGEWTTVIDATTKEVYRSITEDAPEIYPRWARWVNREALTCYRSGLELEHKIRSGDPEKRIAEYERCYALYRRASQIDPDNMMARLRAANCLERIATNLEGPAQTSKRIEALQAYASVHLRQPTIFEAGFRLSILLSGLGEHPPTEDGAATVRTVLDRLERARRYAFHEGQEQSLLEVVLAPVRQVAAVIVAFFAGEEDPQMPAAQRALVIELLRASRRESGLARGRLRPLWTIIHEGRLRHRFEPTGRDRRQLRKALGISKMCIRANRAHAAHRRLPVSDLVQFCWRGWVHWRYMVGRSHVAGWQAHYNAACFYAILPQASDPNTPLGAERVRNRALWHLSRAVDQADDSFSCAYARDEDPDLQSLRDYSGDAFRHVLGRVCPDDLTVHFVPSRPYSWGLHVSGAALFPEGITAWDNPLKAIATANGESTFRIRIFDENKPLEIRAHSGETRDRPAWSVIPAETSSNVWIYSDDPTVYRQPRESGV